MASNWKLTNRVWHANLGMLSAITLGVIALSCPVIAHKWEAGKFLEEIHYGKFLPPQTRWIWIDGQGFLLAFLIVSGLLMHRKSVKKAANTAADDPAVAGSSVTLLHLGGDETPALALAERAEKSGLRAFRAGQDAVENLDLTQERWLLLTHGAQPDAEKLARLTERVASLKRGSLKRMEFALQPGLQAQELESALIAAGARAIPAKDEWDKSVLSHLISSSPTLKMQGPTKAGPAKKSPPSAVTASAAGFTLLEMLLGIVIVTAIISVSASSFEGLKRRDGTHEAALEFAQLVREAREMARRTNTYVRLAITTPESAVKLKDAGLAEADLKPGCGMFIFTVPAHRLEPVAFIQPTLGDESDSSLRETALVTRVPLPKCLIGGWTAAPGHANWHDWREHIHLEGPLLSDYLAKEFEAFARTYLQKPPTVWSPTRQAADLTHSPFSVYPSTMNRTPYRQGIEPMVAPLDASEPLTLDDGTIIPVVDVWGKAAVLRWGPVDPAKFPTMPALDFTPEGRLACTDKEFVEVHFRPAPGHPLVYKVFIRSSDGEVHIQ